jgi:hypothetical protein
MIDSTGRPNKFLPDNITVAPAGEWKVVFINLTTCERLEQYFTILKPTRLRQIIYFLYRCADFNMDLFKPIAIYRMR